MVLYVMDGHAQHGSYIGKTRVALLLPMYASVAGSAKSDQILFGIVSQLAPRLDMVHFKIGEASASLAAPAIALQVGISDRCW